MDKHYTQSILKKKSLIALIQIGLHGEVVQFSKLFHFIQIIMIQVAQANFKGPAPNSTRYERTDRELKKLRLL